MLLMRGRLNSSQEAKRGFTISCIQTSLDAIDLPLNADERDIVRGTTPIPSCILGDVALLMDRTVSRRLERRRFSRHEYETWVNKIEKQS